jgi:hypothetical protein
MPTLETILREKITLEAPPVNTLGEVALTARRAHEGFTLDAKQEEALLESLAQIERGDCISPEDLMATLPRQVDSAD